MKFIILILIMSGCSNTPKITPKSVVNPISENFYGIVYTDSTADILNSIAIDSESIADLRNEIELCEGVIVWGEKKIKFKQERIKLQTDKLLIKVRK